MLRGQHPITHSQVCACYSLTVLLPEHQPGLSSAEVSSFPVLSFVSVSAANVDSPRVLLLWVGWGGVPQDFLVPKSPYLGSSPITDGAG